MTTDTEQILAQLPMAQLAKRLGTDEQTARDAAEAALPTLLAGFANEVQDPQRAEALANAVKQDHDPRTLTADDPLEHVDPAEGDKIVSHVFGNDRGHVESQVQHFLGGNAGSLVSKALPILAPIVMSWLAGKLGGAGAGTSAGAGGVGRSGGGLGDILGQMLGGAASGGGSRGGGGGLGDLLGSVLGGAASGGGSRGGGAGGLNDILGQLGGKAGSGGGLDDLLGSILGPGSPAPRATSQRRADGVTDVGKVFGDRS